MANITRGTNLNPHRVPNVAKYRSIAACENTWYRMVNNTNFNAAGGCWEWTSSKNETGYGVFNHTELGGVLAHRLAMHVAGRPVPADMTVDHLCRNRLCVNTSHMEIVTRTENAMRGYGFMAINARKTHCPQGHEYTPENTYLQAPRNKGGSQSRSCKICARNRYQRRAAELNAST